MTENTSIEWAQNTLNFWWGCEEVSPGCAHCYARSLSERFGRHVWGSPETTERYLTKQPWKDVIRWNAKAAETGFRPTVFTQSMSDFFEDHPQLAEWRREAVALMEKCTNIRFLVLTKRIDQVPAMVPHWLDNWPGHIAIGTSVERQKEANSRIHHLLRLPAPMRFLSVEPMLAPVELVDTGALWTSIQDNAIVKTIPDMRLIHWVIVGGESGMKARPIHPDWPRSVREECKAAGIPFLFKQWGSWVEFSQTGAHSCRNLGNGKGRLSGGPLDEKVFPLRFPWGATGPVMVKTGKGNAGRTLDGELWDQYPEFAS